MKMSDSIQFLAAVVLVCSGVAGIVVAESGPVAPGYRDCVSPGTITKKDDELHSSPSAGGYRCAVDRTANHRCSGNTRPKCEVDCDDHCESCFSALSGWVKWDEGPGCIGTCVYDLSVVSECRDCLPGDEKVCAVGREYDADDCMHETGTMAWDTVGDNCI